MPQHEIIVSNIGSVFLGKNAHRAEKIFRAYRRASYAGVGRASNESVTWMRDNEIYREYLGNTHQVDVLP